MIWHQLPSWAPYVHFFHCYGSWDWKCFNFKKLVELSLFHYFILKEKLYSITKDESRQFPFKAFLNVYLSLLYYPFIFLFSARGLTEFQRKTAQAFSLLKFYIDIRTQIDHNYSRKAYEVPWPKNALNIVSWSRMKFQIVWRCGSGIHPRTQFKYIDHYFDFWAVSSFNLEIHVR